MGWSTDCYVVANELLLFLYVFIIGCNDSTIAQIISFIMISIITAITVIDEDH